MNKYKINQSVSFGCFGCVEFELSYISSCDKVRKIIFITIEETDIDKFIDLLEDFGFEKEAEDIED